MKRVFRYRQKSIRFRRWSRKAYSVFCSVGKHITIGRVSAGIADASLKKSKSSLAIGISMFICMLCGKMMPEEFDLGSPPWLPELSGMPMFAPAYADCDSVAPKSDGKGLFCSRDGRKAVHPFLYMCIKPELSYVFRNC